MGSILSILQLREGFSVLAGQTLTTMAFYTSFENCFTYGDSLPGFMKFYPINTQLHIQPDLSRLLCILQELVFISGHLPPNSICFHFRSLLFTSAWLYPSCHSLKNALRWKSWQVMGLISFISLLLHILVLYGLLLNI